MGVGKEPISSKSKLGNHCLNLILHIPGQVQYKFQAPFKMIFLEKNALDCEIWIGRRQSVFNKNDFLYVPFQIIFFLIKQVANFRVFPGKKSCV